MEKPSKSGFVSSVRKKDIFVISLAESEPLQALVEGMTSLIHLGFHFHAADEDHLDLLLGFYDDASQDLPDHSIVIGEWMIFHTIDRQDRGLDQL